VHELFPAQVTLASAASFVIMPPQVELPLHWTEHAAPPHVIVPPVHVMSIPQTMLVEPVAVLVTPELHDGLPVQLTVQSEPPQLTGPPQEPWPEQVSWQALAFEQSIPLVQEL